MSLHLVVKVDLQEDRSKFENETWFQWGWTFKLLCDRYLVNFSVKFDCLLPLCQASNCLVVKGNILLGEIDLDIAVVAEY